jgi:hypothetical protein
MGGSKDPPLRTEEFGRVGLVGPRWRAVGRVKAFPHLTYLTHPTYLTSFVRSNVSENASRSNTT